MKAGIDLVSAINELVEERLRSILDKQRPLLEKGINEIEHALGRIEGRLGRMTGSGRGAVRRLAVKVGGRKKRGKGPKKCRKPGCSKPARSRGLCSAHYMAALRKGKKPGAGTTRGRKPKTRGGKKCSIRGCRKPARSRGLCSAHYMAALRRGDFK